MIDRWYSHIVIFCLRCIAEERSGHTVFGQITVESCILIRKLLILNEFGEWKRIDFKFKGSAGKQCCKVEAEQKCVGAGDGDINIILRSGLRHGNCWWLFQSISWHFPPLFIEYYFYFAKLNKYQKCETECLTKTRPGSVPRQVRFLFEIPKPLEIKAFKQ